MEKKAKSKGGSQTRHVHGGFPRSSSFSGRFPGEPLEKILDPKSKKPAAMRRPNTHPELLRRDKPPFERTPWLNLEAPQPNPPLLSKIAPPVEPGNSKSAAKLLVNVTVARSIGPLRLLLPTDATVLDVVKGALAQYAKEGRRPILSTDLLSFGLHYSQFTIDCLNPNDKMKDLGCRNFFLCPKKESGVVSCGTEMGKFAAQGKEPWYYIMNRFLALP